MYRRSETLLLAWVGLMMLAGCFAAGLRVMMPVEKDRAREQRQHANNSQQIIDQVAEALPEDTPKDVPATLITLKDIQARIEKNAVKSERWHAAGEKIVGPPKEEVEINTTHEDAVLAQTEKDAETMGKVRGLANAARGIATVVTGKDSGGGIGGWVTGGGLVATISAVAGLAEVGRRKLKKQEQQRQAERDADEVRRQEEQSNRDKEQDQKLDTLMTVLNTRIAEMERQIKKAMESSTPPTS
jgi:hypothetical protein